MPSDGNKPARARYDYTLANEDPDLSEKTLDEILLSKTQLWERGTQSVHISHRKTPIGYKPICKALARESGRSRSQVMAIATIHGVTIIRRDQRYISYEMLLSRLNEGWLKLSSPVRSLEGWQPVSIRFKLLSPQEDLWATCRLPEDYAGAVQEMADDLELPISTAALVASQVSLSTLKADLGFLKWVREDVGAFWTYLVARDAFLKGISLGTQAPSK